METYKDAIAKTEYTSDAVDNDKEKFDAYMLNEKEKLVIKLAKVKVANKESRNLTLDFDIVTEEKKKLKKDVKELLGKVYGVAGSLDREHIEAYFKDYIPHKVRKLKDYRLVFNITLTAINNGEPGDIFNFSGATNVRCVTNF